VVTGERRRAPEISLDNPNRYPEVDRGALGSWLSELLADLAPQADSLAVRFVGSRAMRLLNSTYRDIDGATDVLSFPGESTPEGRHLGDLAIAVPVARRQAKELGHSAERELRCLLLHGVLHCLGHDHEADDGEMDSLELQLRARWVDSE
jgi:rRNA maturation RNase YbeY